MTKRLILRESHPPYTLSIEEEDVLGQEPIILERDGQPIAAIASLAEYEAFRAWQEVHFARETPSPEEILRLAAQVYECSNLVEKAGRDEASGLCLVFGMEMRYNNCQWYS